MSRLRHRLDSLRAGGGSAKAPPADRSVPPPADRSAPLPGVDRTPSSRGAPGAELETVEGPVRIVSTVFEPGHRHGDRRLDELIDHWEHAEAAALGRMESAPERVSNLVFLDAETTGLGFGAGIRVFLLGIAGLDPVGRLRVAQLWLAEAGQERALLHEGARLLAGAGAVVSFNGKSFDLPLLESRALLHRLDWPSRPHLDLLHPARRLVARGLPDVRLGTVERRVLGFEREGDIDGSQAPAAWFDWLRQGRVEPLEAVLRHNLLDLLSLVTLASSLLSLVRHPSGRAGPTVDPLALSEYWLGRGRRQEAAAALARCDEAGRVGRLLRQARLCKRLEGAETASALWRLLLESPGAGPEPFEELSKFLEHRGNDAFAAREVAFVALRRFGRRGRVRVRLEHRLARLERKCRAGGFPPLRPCE